MPDNKPIGQSSDDQLLGSLNPDTPAEGGKSAHFPNLILGTGSGRCGTMSLAKTVGAVHEPGHWAYEPFVQYWRGDLVSGKINDWALNCYKEHADESIKAKGGFVDARLSFIMPLALEWWPNARWIVVFRHPFDTCRSWLERGCYLDGLNTPNNVLFRPRWNWWDDQPRAVKLAWKWNEHYRQILDHDNGSFEYWYADHDLDSVENAGKKTHKLTGDDEDFIEDLTFHTWFDLMYRRDRRASNA